MQLSLKFFGPLLIAASAFVSCNQKEKMIRDHCEGLQMILNDYPNEFMNITHPVRDETKAARDGNVQFNEFFQSGWKFAKDEGPVSYQNYRFAIKTLREAQQMAAYLLASFQQCHIHWNEQDVSGYYYRDSIFQQPADGNAKHIYDQYIFKYREHQNLSATDKYRNFAIRLRVKDDHYGTFAVELIAGNDSAVIQ